MSDTILAIDLGRYKGVACVYHRGTREHTFRAVDMTPEAVDHLLARHPGALVVVEACANAGWVHDRAVAAGHAVKVANTAAESWKFKHLKWRTDRDDALRLAELEAIGQLPTVTLPDPPTRHPPTNARHRTPGTVRAARQGRACSRPALRPRSSPLSRTRTTLSITPVSLTASIPRIVRILRVGAGSPVARSVQLPSRGES